MAVSEVVQAAAKHRDAALSLKEISDKQRKRISEYRDRTIDLQNKIDQIQLDLERDFTFKVCEEKTKFEHKDLEQRNQ